MITVLGDDNVCIHCVHCSYRMLRRDWPEHVQKLHNFAISEEIIFEGFAEGIYCGY